MDISEVAGAAAGWLLLFGVVTKISSLQRSGLRDYLNQVGLTVSIRLVTIWLVVEAALSLLILLSLATPRGVFSIVTLSVGLTVSTAFLAIHLLPQATSPSSETGPRCNCLGAVSELQSVAAQKAQAAGLVLLLAVAVSQARFSTTGRYLGSLGVALVAVSLWLAISTWPAARTSMTHRKATE